MLTPLLIATALLACGKDDPAGVDSGAADGPTWHGDVQPILARSCMSCHDDGSIAPFSLTTYDDAKTWAAAAASAAEARTMPPWLVVDDGTCGDWADSQWLTEDEIATLRAWADAGAPEGVETTPAQVAPLARLDGDVRQISTPVFTPEIVGGEYAEFDEYRCFRADFEVTGDAFLTGYDVQPGNAPMVHHVLVMPVDPEMSSSGGRTVGEVMDEVDGADGREGWPCFSGAGTGIPELGIPVTWAPGQGAVDYPAGTGVKLEPGQELVIQVHYNLVDEAIRGQSDQTFVDLEIAPSVEREAFFALPDGFLDTLGSPFEASLEPGQDAVEYSWRMRSAELLYYYAGDTSDVIGGEIAGVMPHMHQYGRQMNVTMSDECITQVDQWDFNWQRSYFYQEPIPVAGDERIVVTCTYDTTSVDQEITPGWGTYNEMCLPVFYVILNRL